MTKPIMEFVDSDVANLSAPQAISREDAERVANELTKSWKTRPIDNEAAAMIRELWDRADRTEAAFDAYKADHELHKVRMAQVVKAEAERDEAIKHHAAALEEIATLRERFEAVLAARNEYFEDWKSLRENVRVAKEALKLLYDETADYITINKLGPVHHNRSMQMARDALARLRGDSK